MPCDTIQQERRWEAQRARESGEKAPAETKPFFDMLGIWNLYGNIVTPETDSEYARKTDALIKSWAQSKGLPFSLFIPGHSPITPAEAPGEASGIIDRGLGLITVLNTIGVIAEAASLGQMESVIWAMTNVINASGLPSIIQDLYRTPVEIGVKKALERNMLSAFQPNLPDVASLTTLKARALISESAYNAWMAEHGFPSWAAEMMAYAKTGMPDVGTLLDLTRRKIITESMLTAWILKSGMHPDAAPALAKLRYRMPGAQDLIEIYMKEGYLPEKWVEIPEDFIDYMDQQGLSSFWAQRIWGKHWVLPGVSLLYEMFHKEIITFDTMVQMLKYHDFEPVWRQRLIENAYVMIPRVDLRRAFRYNMLRAEDLQKRYRKLGFREEDAAIEAGIATRSSLDRYYTRLETVARAAYRKGRLTREAFLGILQQINTPQAAIDLAVEAETIAREAEILEPAEEPRTLSVSQVLSLYKERILSQPQTLKRLTDLGLSQEDAALLIQWASPKPETVEINRELITAASAKYKEGLMERWVFEMYLRKAGLSEMEIASKVATEDLRYELDYMKDLIALEKEAYKKDVSTAEEFEANLLYYGMVPERALAIVALEEYRKLPKPRAGG